MQRALIVDDSRAIRSILARMLGKQGFANIQAENGAVALQLLERETEDISLVCVDYNMPEMNGVDFVEHLRRSPRFNMVPAMMITTETHIEFMHRAFAAGVSEYLMKPFTEAMVRDKLDVLRLLPEEAH
jgi:two-component system chemotaxis response regulator CheY